MKKINIAGIPVSIFALGAGAMGPIEHDADQFTLRDRYIEHGGNFFDTARKYQGGKTDEAIGRWLKSRKCRDDVVICMKGAFPADTQKMYLSRLSPQDIALDLEVSLKAMDIERADFYLLHRDDPTIPVENIMPTMHELVQAGKTRAIGCSNWTIGRIIEANEFAVKNGLTPFCVSQMHFSLAQTTPAQTGDITHVTMNDVEFGWYKSSQFPVMGFASQGRGYFHRKINGIGLKPGGALYYDHIPENHARTQRLVTLSRETGYSTAAICAAYVRDSGLNAIVLNSFSSIQQLDDVLGAMDFELTPDQVKYLESGII